jgi:predicted ferric reductase
MHITMQVGFALRNLIYTTDSIISFVAVPVLLVVIAWLGRRDILRAVKWSAIFALVFSLLDLLAILVVIVVERELAAPTMARAFTQDALQNGAVSALQLALATGALVAALSLLAAAQRGRWRWFWLLAILTTLGIVLHGVGALNALSFVRNFRALGYLRQQAVIAVAVALLPIAALVFSTRPAADHATNETAPAQQL